MGLILTSPIKEFPGTITLIDNPTLEMLAAFNDASWIAKTDITRTAQCMHRFDSANAFIQRWDIIGQDEHPTRDTLKVIPRYALRDLLIWVIESIERWLDDEQEIPKDLEPVVMLLPQQADTNPAN